MPYAIIFPISPVAAPLEAETLMDDEKKIQLSIHQTKRDGKTDDDGTFNGEVLRSFPELTKESRTILNTFNDVVFILDQSGRFVFVNKASEERTGIPAKALLGLSYLDIVDPKSRKKAIDSFQTAMKGEKSHPFEMEWQSADGETVTIQVNWDILYEEDTVVGLLAAMRDISQLKRAQTALKEAHDELEKRVRQRTAELELANEQLKLEIKERVSAEESLRVSEQKYKALFENSADAVFIVSIDNGIILDANEQAEKLTGIPRKKLIGLPQTKLFPGDHESYYASKFQNHIATSPTFDIEAEIERKDGINIPVFISSGLITMNGKTVLQEILIDISKDKLISDLKEELETKKLVNKAKSIIARRYKLNDTDAIRMLQKESRRQSRKIKDVAQAVISSKFIFD